MKTSFIILAILFAAPAFTQEVQHAPTVAQCQADERLWSSKLEASELNDVTFKTLIDWQHEMNQCRAVDRQHYSDYYGTEAEAQAVAAAREFNFIRRHDLLDQFLAEDAAGKR
jgi:hypothetical protein